MNRLNGSPFRSGRSLLVALLVAAGAPLLAGCAPHWAVVHQAAPNPFAGQKRFAIEATSFEGLMVQDKSEDKFKAGRDATENQKWDDDKKAVSDAFAASLQAAAPYEWATDGTGDPVVIRAHVTQMHGGISLGLGSTAAHIDMTLQLVKGKDVLDEISLGAEATQGEGFRIGGFATSGYTGSDRLKQAAGKLGEYAASYLKSRTAP